MATGKFNDVKRIEGHLLLTFQTVFSNLETRRNVVCWQHFAIVFFPLTGIRFCFYSVGKFQHLAIEMNGNRETGKSFVMSNLINQQGACYIKLN